MKGVYLSEIKVEIRKNLTFDRDNKAGLKTKGFRISNALS
jgi:hypothetical protein